MRLCTEARAVAADASVGQLDLVRRQQYMEEQRKLLIAKKAAARNDQLAAGWLST